CRSAVLGPASSVAPVFFHTTNSSISLCVLCASVGNPSLPDLWPYARSSLTSLFLQSVLGFPISLPPGHLATVLYTTLIIDSDTFYPHQVSDLDHVFYALYAKVRQLRNVNQPIFAGQDLNECAKILDRYNPPLIRLAYFNLLGHPDDDFFCAIQTVAVG